VSLNLVSFTDTLQGNIASHFTSPLGAGATQSYSYDYVVPPGAPDPLVNTATAHYGITGLPNDITDTSTVTVDLVHPAIRITKSADTAYSKAGDVVHYTITVTTAVMPPWSMWWSPTHAGSGRFAGFAARWRWEPAPPIPLPTR